MAWTLMIGILAALAWAPAPASGMIEAIEPHLTQNQGDDLEWLRKQKNKTRRKPRECGTAPKPLPGDYRVYPVEAMDFFHCSSWVSKNARDCLEGNLELGNGRIKSSSRWDVITNGTFCASDDSLGAIMREGRVEVTGAKTAWARGGIGVLGSGEVVACDLRREPFTVNRDLAMVRIRRACGQGGGDLAGFMGGGTLLLHEGNRVSEEDIVTVQKLSRLRSGEHRVTEHVLVATRNGKAVLVIAKDNAAEIQKNFCASGYDSVVKFDGGAAYSVRTRHGYNSATIPCAGILITTPNRPKH